MATDNEPRELARAAGALIDNPADLGQWLEVGSLLAASQRGEAADAFEQLGAAANALGQVALAVACARWLEQNDRAAEGMALLVAIAARHCHGSAAVDVGARPAPPAVKAQSPAGKSKPPPAPKDKDKEKARAKATVPDKPLTLDAAVAKAQTAMKRAAADAAKRAPATGLAPTPLVHALGAEEFLALVENSRLRALGAGAIAVDVGQPADALYWVARGRLEVSRNGALLGELRPNTFFGEIALVGGTTRTATVTCVEDTWLLELPAAHLEAVASSAPRLATVLASHARARLLANVLRTSDLFSRLADDERQQLLARFTTYLAEPGTTIIARDTENEHLYVVVSGKLEVRDAGGLLATVGVGDGVGEMSLIARRPAVADVVAVERSALLRLPRSEFEQFVVNHPGLLAELYKRLLEREQQNKALVVHDATELVV